MPLVFLLGRLCSTLATLDMLKSQECHLLLHALRVECGQKH